MTPIPGRATEMCPPKRRAPAAGPVAAPALLLACGLLAGASARAASLADALAEAYDSNPTLLAARAQLRETDEAVPQALSGWRPHVEIEAAVGSRVRQNTVDLKYRPEDLTPQDYRMSVTQNLYTSGRVLAETKRAHEQVELGRAVLLTTTETVLLAAGTAFADVARDRELLSLERLQEEVLGRTLDAAGIQVAAGQVTEADRQEVRARFERQRSDTAIAEAALRGSEARYEQQIGAAAGDVVLPGEPLGLPASEADAIAAGRDANPAVIAARDAVAISRLGVDLAIDQLLPNIALEGLLQRIREYQYQSHAQAENQAQALVVLTVPLYQGGLLYSRIRGAKEGNLHAQDLLDEERRAAREVAITDWAALQAARTRIDDEEAALEADRIAADGIARQQQVGARTVIDVLVAEQDTLASATALVAAERDRVVDGLALLAAAGSLDASHLRLPTDSYDPVRHYLAVHELWAGTTPPPSRLIRPKGPLHPGRHRDGYP